ncbi:thioether cross-link-forming SCIFF peptide maturase [Thermanaeromonas sp. C210]|uniref:thioether cross-link-forming SCIFF peptide maturase n=1 Tax=Thermanaeromonas sp. C210 TaxID=2731925 RepID=UPI00155B99AB|nr:thioether cross-link-forming SCIFF peptide maturase [Thermanaeromonas sp. C210]GFN23010.1 thioether cross-link-forming SCIFF peptide maturase [Thermanaeromonas sp. C210]
MTKRIPDLRDVDWQADIHWFTFNDLDLLLDVNSGALHIIDQPTKDVLADLAGCNRIEYSALARSTGCYGREVVDEVLADLARCQEEGSLFTRDLAAGLYRPPEPVLQALCLHVSHDCNMRCRYCFAGGGPFGGRRGLMSRAVGRAALDLLFRLAGRRPRVEVDFFGGEPLLNFDTVRELVAYGRARAEAAGKEIRFTLTTNGLGLTPEIEEFLNRERISVILSLDGRPNTHDRYRRLPDGEGSYAQVVPRLKALTAARGHEDYWIRGTYTRDNLDFSRDVEHLLSLGFRFISLEPVVAPPQAPYSLRMEDIPTVRREYSRLADLYCSARREGRPFEFFHFNLDLGGGPCLTKRLYGCGAGVSYMAVTPDGELYPCHQLVGRSEFRLGHVQRGIERPDLQEEFRQAYVYRKPRCARCWARFYCSGGCHAAALASTGNLREPDEVACALQQSRLEASLYILAKLKANFSS